MNRLNLIPAQRRLIAARRRRVLAWSCVCAASAAILALGAGTFRIARSVDPAGVQGQIKSAAARAEAAEAELEKLVALAREREKALDSARIVGVHPDWSVLLRAINAARGETIALEIIELRSDPILPPAAPAGATPAAPPARAKERYILKLSGIATGVQDVTRFVTQLESLGAMQRVWLKNTSPRMVRGAAVSGFEIECTLMEREPPRVEVAP